MGIKLLKIAFVAATNVISFTVGAGVGAIAVAYAVGKVSELSKEDPEKSNEDEKDQVEADEE